MGSLLEEERGEGFTEESAWCAGSLIELADAYGFETCAPVFWPLPAIDENATGYETGRQRKPDELALYDFVCIQTAVLS